MLVAVTTTSTIIVSRVASFLVGQVTFFNSAIVSPIYLKIAFFFLRELDFATRRLHRTTISSIDQAGEAGIEPATPGFGDRCSARLSYSPL